ncbi:hypothetical protein QAD02_023995 [Eretmocerus hayati]|uniref:Uncharacterized protein n=1 Tax=Eretmocerus hayati TaxID=131215 RepID=A0ACC2Q2A6_9HYME|nr:hypothetical protein QAD02_023995 [Eretmocerus hayati]
MCADQNKQDLLIKTIRDLDIRNEVRTLLENGADINSTDNKEGVSPLEAAVETGLMETIQLLLELGADAKAVNSRGRSILYTWAETVSRGEEKEWRYSEMLHLLISHGAWVTDEDVSKNSDLLSTILQYGNHNVAKLVTDHLKKNNASMPNMLHTAAANEDSPETLKSLLSSKQFDINETDFCGQTPLHVAAFRDHPEHLTLLLEHGADPNIKDREGETPLTAAADEGRPWIIEILCAYGADINVTNHSNQTLLDLASQADILPSNKCLCIIKQIALLESQSREINQKLYSQVQRSPRYKKYFFSCKKEIELAQKSVIDGSVTYYKILTDQDADSFANNKKVLSALKSKSFVNRFDIYGQRICMHFVKVRPDQKKLFKLFEDKNLGMLMNEDDQECILS